MARATALITIVFAGALCGLLGFLAGGGGPAAASHGSTREGVGAASFADVVERVNPGVVHIATVEASPTDDDDSSDPDSRDFPRRGEGSGFVVDARHGFILTNHHLVGNSTRIRVRLADKREAPATLVGSDTNTDLALIKIDLPGLHEIPLGDSDALRVGEWVCAIGNPYIFEHSVTVGVVSSKGRKIWDPSFDSFIQTDAAINPGNSGGPLINVHGQAVGINSAVSTEGQGIGFAIPINVARDILDQLRTKGRVSRGYLGIQLHDLDPDLGTLLGTRNEHGAVVMDVLPGSAAESAGLRRYDVITAVAGEPVVDGDQLIRSISARPPGSRVSLAVLRDGHETRLEARLTERSIDPSPQPTSSQRRVHTPAFDRLGLTVTELSVASRADLKVPQDRLGVVVDEVAAASAGLDAPQHGDIIVEMNRRPTPNLAAYRRLVAALKPGEVAWLYIYRVTTNPRGSFLAKLEPDRP
jgi:serine protease Do